MNMVSWCNGICENKKTQALLEEKVESLLAGPLAEKGEYAQEKAIKAFSEGLGYLESNLLRQRDIHHSNLDLVKIRQNPQEYTNKYEEVEKIMATEISRNFRHWITFL